MAKKRKIINLKNLNLEFEDKGTLYQLLSFNTQHMTIDTKRINSDNFSDNFTLPFAHLPKKLKKIVKQDY